MKYLWSWLLKSLLVRTKWSFLSVLLLFPFLLSWDTYDEISVPGQTNLLSYGKNVYHSVQYIIETCGNTSWFIQCIEKIATDCQQICYYSPFRVYTSIHLQKADFILTSMGICTFSMSLSPFGYFLQKEKYNMNVSILAQLLRKSQRKWDVGKFASQTWVQIWMCLSKPQQALLL